MGTDRELREWRGLIGPELYYGDSVEPLPPLDIAPDRPRGLLAIVSPALAVPPRLTDVRVSIANALVTHGFGVDRIDWRELHGFEGDDG